MGWLAPGEWYPSEVLERNVALYDGEIAWMDASVGRLLAAGDQGESAHPAAAPGEGPDEERLEELCSLGSVD